jgi:hypothetical protein
MVMIPGRFGIPSFHPGVFLSFFLATLLSVLDSIGDYCACARMCYVPQPPTWAVNRGIAIEGLMSTLSGCLGVGHACVSFGGNIGAIGITKVSADYNKIMIINKENPHVLCHSNYRKFRACVCVCVCMCVCVCVCVAGCKSPCVPSSGRPVRSLCRYQQGEA